METEPSRSSGSCLGGLRVISQEWLIDADPVWLVVSPPRSLVAREEGALAAGEQLSDWPNLADRTCTVGGSHVIL